MRFNNIKWYIHIAQKTFDAHNYLRGKYVKYYIHICTSDLRSLCSYSVSNPARQETDYRTLYVMIMKHNRDYTDKIIVGSKRILEAH